VFSSQKVGKRNSIILILGFAKSVNPTNPIPKRKHWSISFQIHNKD
jgi:hypothetical protein